MAALSVEVESYLRMPDGSYVRVEDAAVPLKDRAYIEGYIRLAIYGQEVMGEAEWDLVDQLWGHIARMLAELQATGAARTLFPDQPLELAFRRFHDVVVVSCGDRQATDRRPLRPVSSSQHCGMAD